jgi:hypothetical protein
MANRNAACSCGQLRLEAVGDPIRISMCHCLACQRRTGSAFAVQARFPAERVRISGRSNDYVRLSDSHEEARRFSFCPECGATVFYTTEDAPDLIAVPVGAFADPSFPPPTVSVHENRKHPWVGLPAELEEGGPWDELRPLYDAGEYEQVADLGGQLIAAHPGDADLLYNVACCESLSGRADGALAHLRLAIDASEALRRLAARDSDLDAIRADPAFTEIVGS